MKIPLSKKEFEIVEKLAKKKHGITTTQQISLIMLHYFEKHDPELFEKARKKVDPEVLQIYEKS